MNLHLLKRSVAFLAVSLLFACNKISVQEELTVTKPVSSQTQEAAFYSRLASNGENFETGTKTSYTTGNILLSSGNWTLNDALIGNSTADRKNGLQSARIRNSGRLSMLFDHPNGASTVSIVHARYGTDASSTWQLWYSTNGGTSYTQAGSTVTSGSTSLTTASFTINVAGNIRLEIRKNDGSANRINIDDINITDFSSGGTPPPTSTIKFLFDASQGETAGNADWVIDQDNGSAQRTPTPLQSTITSTTGETYWTGGISAWGIQLAKLGHSVETLPSTGSITYGSSTNTQDLSRYQVFVVDEPNIRFTSSEKTAILNFVRNGGGLFIVGNHNQSDRNNDGWDAPAIWNDLFTNNGSVSNPFGMSFNLVNISQLSTNVWTNATASPVLRGSQGTVTALEYNNGSTLNLSPSANASVQGLIWTSGSTQGTTNVMCASSSYGTGRVVAICDSSPTDDGTGNPGDILYNGWGVYSHRSLMMNASLWLAKIQ